MLAHRKASVIPLVHHMPGTTRMFTLPVPSKCENGWKISFRFTSELPWQVYDIQYSTCPILPQSAPAVLHDQATCLTGQDSKILRSKRHYGLSSP